MSAPRLNRFSFRSLEYKRDPWGVFADFRDQGPVIRMKMPLIGTGWGATTYESVSRVFKDDELFVRDPKNADRRTLGWIQWLLPRSFMVLANNMMASDGLDHRRLRGLVDQAFARRNIEGMAGRIRWLADEQLHAMTKRVNGDGHVDLIEHFARPFPLTVICELLGVPLEDRNRFRKWFEPLSGFSGITSIFRMVGGIKRMSRYMLDQFESVRRQPREGLVSELVAVHDGGDSLSDEELLAMVMLLFIAGHETTVHLISNAVFTLAQHPDSKQALLDDWSKCDGAIDEVLRYSSPIQIGKPRYVTRDADFFGQRLKRGETITPLIAAANHDPTQFDEPETFDIDRKPNYHMTFGSGPHTCLGMKLAKTETASALQTLYTNWPELEPVKPSEQAEWSPRPGMRSLRSLVIRK